MMDGCTRAPEEAAILGFPHHKEFAEPSSAFPEPHFGQHLQIHKTADGVCRDAHS